MRRRGFLSTLLGLATVPLFGRKPRPSALALLRDSSQEWVKGPLKGDPVLLYGNRAISFKVDPTLQSREVYAILRRRQ